MRMMLATFLAAIGVFLWFWGGLHLMGRKSYFWKIHALSIADTVGTLFILGGTLLCSTEGWNHVLLAMGAVAFWGTALSFVLARLGGGNEGRRNNE